MSSLCIESGALAPTNLPGPGKVVRFERADAAREGNEADG
jgi:hypothetical protein